MKKYFLITLIIIFRIIDLIITDYFFVNYQNNSLDGEMNLLVEYFNITNKYVFYGLEVLGILFFIIIYLYYLKNKELFKIKSSSFINYITTFFYKKSNISLKDFLFKMSFKKVLVLIGSITPLFVIITSTLYILNNWFVIKSYESSYYYKLYYKIDNAFSFNKIIYILPIVILITLIILKLKKGYQILNR